jgi:hypothetical protein
VSTYDPADEEELAAYLDAYVSSLADRSIPAPRLGAVATHLRDEAVARAAIIAAAWATGPIVPVVGSAVAVRFGFDRPDLLISIDGRIVARERKRGGMNVRDFVEALNRAGGQTSVQEIFTLETTASNPTRQPLVSAIVAVCNIRVTTLEVNRTELNTAQAFLYGSEFEALIEEWCAEHQADAVQTSNIVRQRASTPSFRATDVTVAQMRDIVRALLRTLEQ